MAENTIRVEKKSKEELEAQGVFQWPIWTHEAATFPWEYDTQETCYILEGKVTVTPEGGGEPVEIQAGDYVVFPKGLKCTWTIHEPVRKHYNFG